MSSGPVTQRAPNWFTTRIAPAVGRGKAVAILQAVIDAMDEGPILEAIGKALRETEDIKGTYEGREWRIAQYIADAIVQPPQ